MQKIDSEDEPVNKILYNKHRRRKNNDIVAAMYAMYCLPKSLEQVGDVYHKSRQAVHDLFSSRGYVMRSKELKGLQIIDGIHFNLNPDGYMRGTVEGKRMMLHRFLWEKYNGPIPEGYGVKFKDENRENNKIENLMLYKLSGEKEKREINADLFSLSYYGGCMRIDWLENGERKNRVLLEKEFFKLITRDLQVKNFLA